MKKIELKSGWMIVSLGAVLALSGCRGNGGSGSVGLPLDGSDAESVSLAVESAVGSVNTALNDAEQSATYALRDRGGSFSEWLVPSAYAASCGLSRFTPSIGSGSCAGTAGNRTVTSNFGGCTAGPSDEFILSGTVSLAFDSATTCDTWVGGAFPTSGSVTRTMSSFTRINPNGSQVVSDSANHLNYRLQTVGGGIRTTFTAGARQIDVLGLHRRGYTSGGGQWFDHSVRTLSPIVVSGTKAAGNRAISSGTIRIDHNGSRYGVDTTLSGLTWAANCCHPMSGSLNFAIADGNNAGSWALSFNTGTCGRARITGPRGNSADVVLQACE